MLMDGAQEQATGDFRKKLQMVDCRVRQFAPYTLKSNAAERAIKELKRGAGRKMIKSRCPKQLRELMS